MLVNVFLLMKQHLNLQLPRFKVVKHLNLQLPRFKVVKHLNLWKLFLWYYYIIKILKIKSFLWINSHLFLIFFVFFSIIGLQINFLQFRNQRIFRICWCILVIKRIECHLINCIKKIFFRNSLFFNWSRYSYFSF